MPVRGWIAGWRLRDGCVALIRRGCRLLGIRIAQRRLLPRPGAAAGIEAWISERRWPAERRRELAVSLRAGLGFLAGCEVVEDLTQACRGKILVIVVVDLRRGGVHAGAQALDLDPGQLAVGTDVELLADPLVTKLDELTGTAQQARRGAAELDMKLAHRREIEHGVEGRDFERPHLGHAEKTGDMLDRLLRQPTAGLLLRASQERNDRWMLPAGGIFRDFAF